MSDKHTFRPEEAIIPRSIEIGHSRDRRLVLLYIELSPNGSLTLALPTPFARRHLELLGEVLQSMSD